MGKALRSELELTCRARSPEGNRSKDIIIILIILIISLIILIANLIILNTSLIIH